jgi:hypothetical protein
MRTSTKITAVIGGAALTIATAGVAYAYYTSTSSGSTTGSATAATSTIGAVTPTAATAITGLVPGGSAQNATVTLTNPNAFSVALAAGKSVGVSTVTGPVGCATNAVASLSGSVAIPAQTIPANGTTTVIVPVSMADAAFDQTSCNGASFTVTYLVS